MYNDVHVIRLGKLDVIMFVMNDKLRILELLKDSFEDGTPDLG